MKPQKIWRLAENQPAIQQLLAQELKISNIVARIMVNRGIISAEAGREFLWADLQYLHTPGLLPDMEKAVLRVVKAIEQHEKILIYGDYDVDGITSTTVLTLTLRGLGAQVDYYIPDRIGEGYGLNMGALEWAQAEGFTLVITVDSGISAVQEALWAQSAGLDLIITDHHEVPAEVPVAVAVIDPKRGDSQYPFSELAGVGVAFKLAQALLQHYHPEQALAEAGQELLDIVALGTIADIVPLKGENRLIVKHGLTLLSAAQRPGLKALLEVCGLAGKQISAGQVGYILAPRINAAGRLGDAKLGVRLLLSNDPEEALAIAQQLDQENKARQQIEAEMVTAAIELIERLHNFEQDKVIMLAQTGWHPGIIGIVASRLVDKYHRPTILLVPDGDQAKGSCRSIPGFDLYQALTECQTYLVKFGGHKQAAGLTLDVEQIEQFRQAINRHADQVLLAEMLHPQVKVDGVVAFSELNLDLVDQLELLEPFGHQNPGPVLACRDAKVVECRGVGKEGVHLKLRVKSTHGVLDAIGFQQGHAIAQIKDSNLLDLAFALEKNEWNNRVSLQLNLKDIKDSTLPDNPFQYWNISLVDQRRCAHKDRYLLDLLTSTSEALIYVNNAQTADQLNKFLQEHQTQLHKQRPNWKIYGEGWGEGILNSSVEDVILYNLPFNNVELKKIIAAASEKETSMQVHLLFGEQDLQLNRAILETTAPGREVLGQLYLLLRELAQSTNPIPTTSVELTSLLQARYSRTKARIEQDTIEQGLLIFEELGLLQTNSTTEKMAILLQAAPKDKLSLEKAAGYQAGLQHKAEAEQFGLRLLKAGTEEIKRLFA